MRQNRAALSGQPNLSLNIQNYSTIISAVTFSPSSLRTIPIAGTEKSGIPSLSQ